MNSLFVIELVLATFLLFGLYGLAGYYCHYPYYFFAAITGRRKRENSNNNKRAEKEDKITGLLAMTYISNILVVLLAHQFLISRQKLWQHFIKYLIMEDYYF